MTPGLVSVIIVNWNGARFLATCLAALESQDYRPLEILIVDNGSTDGSVEYLRSQPAIRLIENDTNVGFARANNQAIAQAKGEYLLLLNADATLRSDYVRRLVQDLQRDPKLGSATGKLLRPSNDGGRTVDSAGHVLYRNLWSANRGEGEPDGPPYDQAEEVFGVCAAAAIYRRKMLDEVAVDGEVFDGDFFAYLEDADLDWRARLHGWRSWYDPQAIAIHQRSGSGLWYSTRIQRHILKNRLLMMIKNDGGPSMYRRLPGIVAFTAAKGVQLLLSRPGALLGFADVVRLLPSTLHKRRIIHQNADSHRIAEPWFAPYPYLRKLREGRLGRPRRPPAADKARDSSAGAHSVPRPPV
jgi:GT2 family glycosyltransferase